MRIQTAFSGLSVDDQDKAKKFYTEILGLTLVDEQMGLKLALPGGGELYLYPKSDHVPPTATSLNFVVEDINTAVDELVSRGVTFEHYDSMPAPQDEREILRGIEANQGPDIAWFKDPAGNILSVMQVG